MLLQLGFLVLLTTIACELAAKRGWIPYWVSRKILHVVAVGSCAVAGYYADTLGHRTVLTWIVAGAEVALLALVGTGVLMREESGRPAWGIVWFPLAFLILLLLIPHAEMIGFCMAVLAVCDPAATTAGKMWHSLRPTVAPNNVQLLDDELISETVPPWYIYNLTGDQKTIVGSGAFFVSFLILCCFFPVIEFTPVIYEGEVTDILNAHYIKNDYSPYFLIGVGLILTAGEALGTRGSDNLIVPLLSCFFMVLASEYFHRTMPVSYATLVIVGASAIFILITVKKRSLTSGGAFTAALLGLIIYHSVGPWFLIPIVMFFLSSSLIGRLTTKKSRHADAKHKQPRDSIQVLANGGLYGAICLTFNYVYTTSYPADVNYRLYLLLLLLTAATATADTWSSELGQYFRHPTYDLLKLRPVPPGLSGGVSLPGTLAGLVGAALIASLGWWLMEEYSPGQFALITAFGFAGMLLDSVLGSLLQATYRDAETGALSDTKPTNGELAFGYPWMTNDLVNFLAILLTVAVAAVIMM